jgi:hypothetical protein
MQRKLTEGEIEKLKQAKSGIGDVLVPTYDDQGLYWAVVLGSLDDKIKHGTTDGKPYVDPEPPIPEGWRKAFDHELTREDLLFWCRDKKVWVGRSLVTFKIALHKGPFYIVPIDPPLTDQDACVSPRRLVMVRDDESKPWQGPHRYLGRNDEHPFPFVIHSNGDHEAEHLWKYARLATPEEIESMNRN